MQFDGQVKAGVLDPDPDAVRERGSHVLSSTGLGGVTTFDGGLLGGAHCSIIALISVATLTQMPAACLKASRRAMVGSKAGTPSSPRACRASAWIGIGGQAR